MSERIVGYIEGIFEILTLLNEDNYGREFYLTEIELKDKTIEEKLKTLIGNEHEMDFSLITNFKFQIEKVYNDFCQNYLYKIGGLKSENLNELELEDISNKLNNGFIKELFVKSLNGFFENSSKVDEVKFDKNYNNGLPYKSYLIQNELKVYFLHFSITI